MQSITRRVGTVQWRRGFSSRPINTVGIVGAGQMGMGIAIVSSLRAGANVRVMDSNQEQLDKSFAFTKKYLAGEVKKGRFSDEVSAQVYSRLSGTTELKDLASSDFVIEAAPESLSIKQDIFRTLDESLPPDVILASNTSSISISDIAAATSRPDKVIGMHFMNPVPKMKLVEVITTPECSPATLDATLDLAKSMEKITTQSKNAPGFIANRILMPYINEAVYTLQEEIATREDIDTTMKLGCAMPMGPLTLADFIGLDTCLAIIQVLHKGFGDDKYKPAPLLEQYVKQGRLGKKSGKGFYDYTK